MQSAHKSKDRIGRNPVNLVEEQFQIKSDVILSIKHTNGIGEKNNGGGV